MMSRPHARAGVLARTVLLVAAAVGLAGVSQAGETRAVVLIIADGLRWQEVFTGAERALLAPDLGGGWQPEKELVDLWWRESPEERRALLFPFLWGTVAKEGQLYGNRTRGSRAHVTNPRHFSYPGYNEILTGWGDPAIDSNDYGPNPNRTLFEWLNERPAFKGRVQAVATWNEFHDIFAEKRSHLPLIAGATPPALGRDPGMKMLDELYRTTTLLDEGDVPNSFMHVAAREVLRTKKPRLLFVGYGETDNWAHQGRYDRVLASAHQFDAFVADLWATAQSIPEYRGHVTFVIATDHGRGHGPRDWKDHGVKQPGSDDIWIAVLGPDTPALGERHDIPDVTQSQIAATIGTLLGEDYRAAEPRAAPPLADALGRAR
jgi:hypothetical protein